MPTGLTAAATSAVLRRLRLVTSTDQVRKSEASIAPGVRGKPAHSENIDLFGAIEVDIAAKLAQLGPKGVPADARPRLPLPTSRLRAWPHLSSTSGDAADRGVRVGHHRISVFWMPGPLHFDTHAEVYDRARPPYPAVVWAELQDLGLLRPGIRAIDLGAGSGLATGPLLEAGASVDAVEPGPALADRLRCRRPAAVVHVDTAEQVELPSAVFDLAVAATAVHWFDLEVVVPKLHRVLRPGGHFAVWRNVFGDPTVSITPFRERVAQIVARRETVKTTARAW